MFVSERAVEEDSLWCSVSWLWMIQFLMLLIHSEKGLNDSGSALLWWSTAPALQSSGFQSRFSPKFFKPYFLLLMYYWKLQESYAFISTRLLIHEIHVYSSISFQQIHIWMECKAIWTRTPDTLPLYTVMVRILAYRFPWFMYNVLLNLQGLWKMLRKR